jgi:hypothetical protein
MIPINLSRMEEERDAVKVLLKNNHCVIGVSNPNIVDIFVWMSQFPEDLK